MYFQPMILPCSTAFNVPMGCAACPPARRWLNLPSAGGRTARWPPGIYGARWSWRAPANCPSRCGGGVSPSKSAARRAAQPANSGSERCPGGARVSDAQQQLARLGLPAVRPFIAFQVVAHAQPIGLQRHDGRQPPSGIRALDHLQIERAQADGFTQPRSAGIERGIVLIDYTIVRQSDDQARDPELAHVEVTAGNLSRDGNPRAINERGARRSAHCTSAAPSPRGSAAACTAPLL